MWEGSRWNPMFLLTWTTDLGLNDSQWKPIFTRAIFFNTFSTYRRYMYEVQYTLYDERNMSKYDWLFLSYDWYTNLQYDQYAFIVRYESHGNLRDVENTIARFSSNWNTGNTIERISSNWNLIKNVLKIVRDERTSTNIKIRMKPLWPCRIRVRFGTRGICTEAEEDISISAVLVKTSTRQCGGGWKHPSVLARSLNSFR